MYANYPFYSSCIQQCYWFLLWQWNKPVVYYPLTSRRASFSHWLCCSTHLGQRWNNQQTALPSSERSSTLNEMCLHFFFCLQHFVFSFYISARLWDWVHGEAWLCFACEYLILIILSTVCCLLYWWWFVLYTLFKITTHNTMFHSLVCLVAAVREEAVFVLEAGLRIWQLNQEYVCAWIRAQFPLHRVLHTSNVYFFVFLHYTFTENMYRLFQCKYLCFISAVYFLLC